PRPSCACGSAGCRSGMWEYWAWPMPAACGARTMRRGAGTPPGAAASGSPCITAAPAPCPSRGRAGPSTRRSTSGSASCSDALQEFQHLHVVALARQADRAFSRVVLCFGIGTAREDQLGDLDVIVEHCLHERRPSFLLT